MVESVFARADVDYGTYEYTLKEVKSGYEGVVYSPSEFKIMVMKYNAPSSSNPSVYEDHIIAKVVRTKLGNDSLREEQKKDALNEKVSGISNNYGAPTPPPENPDTPPVTPPGDTPNDSTHVVSIKKKITGSSVNHSQLFKFEVFVVPASTTGVNEVDGVKQRDVCS